MAIGTITLFNQFDLDIGLKLLNLDTDAIKVGLVTNATIPAATDPYPNWGGALVLTTGTDFSANEIVPATSYVAGGTDIATSYTGNAGVSTFDAATNPTWAQDAGGAADIYYGIIYDSTDADGRAIGFIDLGGPLSLVVGPITITWNAAGIATFS